MTLLFDLKQSLHSMLNMSRNISSDVSKEENKMYNSESKIFDKIEGFEYSENNVRELRTKNRNNIQTLQRALSRIDVRNDNLAVLEAGSMTEWRTYEKNLRTQVYDVKKVIELLSEIVKDEHNEILLDIRVPLITIEDYLIRIKKIIKNSGLTKSASERIFSSVKSIELSYQTLVDTTLKYAENESKYFTGTISFDKYFITRGRLKKQMNGKTQMIIRNIEKLEQTLRQYDTKSNEFYKSIADNVEYFKNQFAGLIEFCQKRIEIANLITHDAIMMQRSKFDELKSLKDELDKIYSEFMKEQNRIYNSEKTDYKKDIINKRIEEYKGYWNNIQKDTKNLDEYVLNIEKEEVKILSKENNPRNINTIKNYIVKMNVDFKKVVATFAAITIIAMQHPVNISADTQNMSKTSISTYISTNAIKSNNTKPAPIHIVEPKDTVSSINRIQEAMKNYFKITKLFTPDTLKLLSTKITPKEDGTMNTDELTFTLQAYMEQSKADSTYGNRKYIKSVQDIIEETNPLYKNKDYLKAIVRQKYNEKNLPSWMTLECVEKQIKQESGYKTFVVSWADARGIGQIIPETWSTFSKLDYYTFVWVPEINIDVSLAYIKYLAKFIEKNDPNYNKYTDSHKRKLVLAGYNAGEGRLEKKGFDISKMPRETRHYVKTIEGDYEKNVWKESALKSDSTSYSVNNTTGK